MDTLHATGYDMTRAISALVPQGGPVLCRDEMEEWSASEANLFEEALEKYGKDFTDIQQDFVSSKPIRKSIFVQIFLFVCLPWVRGEDQDWKIKYETAVRGWLA